ncbi:MAG: VWA domain-containing protein, partial [Neoaquamicrobium sediminum]
MSPYEIAYPGGAVEHWNAEAGIVWLQRVLQHWPKAVWLNPVREKHWGYTHSIQMVRDIFSERMFPLTLNGLEKATRELSRSR